MRFDVQRGLFGAVVFLLSTAVASGATFYVRTDGSDSNTGLTNDWSGAWRTIGYAAAHVSAGDTVRVQAGTYVEVASPAVNGTVGNTVTLVADGAVTTCGMNFSGRSYIRVIGFTLDPSTSGCTPNSQIVNILGTNTGLDYWNDTIQNTNANAFLVDSTNRCNACILIGDTFQNIGNTSAAYTALVMTGDDTVLGYLDLNTICYLGLGPSGHRLRMVNLNFRGMCGLTIHADFIYPQGVNQFGYSNNLMESSYGIGTPTGTDTKGMHVQTQAAPAVNWSDSIWRNNVVYN